VLPHMCSGEAHDAGAPLPLPTRKPRCRPGWVWRAQYMMDQEKLWNMLQQLDGRLGRFVAHSTPTAWAHRRRGVAGQQKRNNKSTSSGVLMPCPRATEHEKGKPARQLLLCCPRVRWVPLRPRVIPFPCQLPAPGTSVRACSSTHWTDNLVSFLALPKAPVSQAEWTCPVCSVPPSHGNIVDGHRSVFFRQIPSLCLPPCSLPPSRAHSSAISWAPSSGASPSRACPP